MFQVSSMKSENMSHSKQRTTTTIVVVVVRHWNSQATAVYIEGSQTNNHYFPIKAITFQQFISHTEVPHPCWSSIVCMTWCLQL